MCAVPKLFLIKGVEEYKEVNEVTKSDKEEENPS